jgi:arsenite methyltransferase
MANNEKDKGSSKKETTKANDSCCSFSHTEEFLKQALGILPNELESKTDISSCNCGCETHSSSELPQSVPDPKVIKDYVKKRYASLITKSGPSCCGPSISRGTPVETSTFQISLDDKRKFAETLGYTEVELKDLPDDVTDISFGCGNPTAIAELKPGEVVLDLGSGGGIDVFLAAKKVGPTGKSIGLDMTPAMIERANANAEKMGLSNVEFKLGEIEAIPLLDDSVDVVISNCVINLSPDKAKVFRQIYRVLKPGGRMAISDIVLNGELPEFIQHDFAAWAGCIAGALQEEDYLHKIRDAGFINIIVESKRSVKELAYAIKENPEVINKLQQEMDCTPEELLNRIVSVKVKAYK